MSWSTERLSAALDLAGMRVVATQGRLLQVRGKHYRSNFMDTYFVAYSRDYITIQLATGMGYAISSNLSETEFVNAIATIHMPRSHNATLTSHEEIRRAGFIEAWEIYEARDPKTNAPLINSFTNDGYETTIQFHESRIVAFRATTDDLRPYCIVIGPSSLEAANQTYLAYLAGKF